MRLVGKTTAGATPEVLAADTRMTIPLTFPLDVTLPKLSVYVDGQGSGVGAQVLAAVLYTPTNTLLAQGEEVEVLDGAEPGWVDLPFATPGGVPVSGAGYQVGLISGGAANTIRFYSDTPGLVSRRVIADTYSDGAATSFGSPSTQAKDFSVFALYTTPWALPVEEELWYARLPWAESQQVFGVGTPIQNQAATCGWYDTQLDPERGAFAVVNTEGALADLLGERLKITVSDKNGVRSVYVYCHNRLEVESDLSLSRRAFSELAMLPASNLRVRVEVMT